MKTMNVSELAPKHPSILIILLWAVALSGAMIWLGQNRYLPEAPDKITYDWRTAVFSDQSEKQRKDIAVVLIDDDSLGQYWARSPVDRGMLAELIKAIDSAGPKAIGLDFIFDRPGDPTKEAALMEAIQQAKAPIIIGAIDNKAQGVRRNSFQIQENFIKDTGRKAGHIRFTTEKNRFSIDDEVVRFIGETAKVEPIRPSFGQQLASITKPNARAQTQYIAWMRGPSEAGKPLFPRIKVPEHKPVDGTGNGESVLPEYQKPLLKDRIVLIGSNFVDMDRHLTPLSYFDERKIAGVFIHAQIIAQMLDERGIFDLDSRLEFIALFFLALVGFYAGYRFNLKKYDFIMGVVGISLLIVAGIVAFSVTNTILPSTALSLSWVISVTGGHFFRWFLGHIKSSAQTAQ